MSFEKSIQQQPAAPSFGVVARNAFRDHPFAFTLGTWAAVLAGTGVYLWKRDIPFQLKVISARILAQAGLIMGAVSLAGVSVLTSHEQAQGPATSNWKLRDFSEVGAERPSPARQAAVAAAELK